MNERALVGRRTELAHFDALCDGVAEQGVALLLEGEPGVGKSALIDEFDRRGRHRGFTMLRTTGTVAETAVPFAGIHLLLHPLRDRFAALPAPQRDALATAFGIEAGPEPTPFQVGVAALTLLAGLARERPLLVICDDAHWIDSGSLTALLIATRRLLSDSVIVVIASRRPTPAQDWRQFERLELSPLSFVESNALLDRRADAPTGASRRVLLEHAQGNPLALLELAVHDVPTARTPPGVADTRAVALTERLEHAFTDRFLGLSTSARAAVLVVALSPDCSIPELRRVVGRLTDDAGDPGWLDEVIGSGLLRETNGGMRFGHPLMSVAVVSRASSTARRQVLAALVESVSAEPQRSVWWRAELAESTDDALAEELDALSTRLAAAGDAVQASRALGAAAELTGSDDPGSNRSAPDRSRSGRRLRAAVFSARTGDLSTAKALLAHVEAEATDARTLAMAAWQNELLPDDSSALLRGDFGPALDAVGRMLALGDRDAAVDAVLQLATIAWDHSPTAVLGEPLRDAVRALELPSTDPRSLFLDAVIDPENNADEVVRRIEGHPDAHENDPEALWMVGYALNLCGEIDRSAEPLARAAALLRTDARMDLLPHVQMALAWIVGLQGRFIEGRALIDECLTWAEDANDARGSLAMTIALTWYDALDGIEPRHVGTPDWLPRILRANLVAAAGIAAQFQGDARTAHQLLARLADPEDDVCHVMFGIVSAPDAVEAALAVGDRAAAESRMSDVLRLHEHWHSPVIHAVARYAELVLAADHLLDSNRAALVDQPLELPYLQARADFVMGCRLRRMHRVAEARAHLQAALERFDALGLPRWTERCREQLRGTGLRLAGQPPSGVHVLTPQELRVAQLARDGLTNGEIATRLFLSPRTVGAHLYNAFRKLGITSRGQLDEVLGEPTA